MEIRRSKNDPDYTEGEQEMKKTEGKRKTQEKIQNDRAKPRSGQRMKGETAERGVRKLGGKKKKVGKIETRSDREKQGGREKEPG